MYLRVFRFMIVVMVCVIGASCVPSHGAGLQLRNLKDTPTADRFTLPTDLVWPTELGEADICLWPDDKFGAVSISVDDNNVPDHEWWRSQVDPRGWKMTWFAIVGEGYICSLNPTYGCWDDFVSLHAGGHEVGSHTMTQQNNDDERPDAEIHWEYSNSQSRISQNVPGAACAVLAYSYGKGKREIAAEYYLGARGVIGGINPANRIDYLWTKSNSSTGLNSNYVAAILTGVSPGISWLSSPANKRGWASAHYHGIGTMKAAISNDLAYLETVQDQIWIGRFGDVIKYGQERDTAALTPVAVSASRIALQLSDDMDDTLYAYPLTLKVRIDNAWTEVRTTQGGLPIASERIEHDGMSYMLVNAVPDKGEIVLRTGSDDGTVIAIRLSD